MQIFEQLLTAPDEPTMIAALAFMGLHHDAGRIGLAHYAINRVGVLSIDTGETETRTIDGAEYTTPIFEQLPGWRVQILWQGAEPPAPPAGIVEDWRTGDAAVPRPPQWAGVAPPPANADAPIEAAAVGDDFDVTDRQFFHALARVGIFTKDEALAAGKTGDMPQWVMDGINQIPDDDLRFEINMILQTGIKFNSGLETTQLLAMMFSKSAADVIAIFNIARSLR